MVSLAACRGQQRRPRIARPTTAAGRARSRRSDACRGGRGMPAGETVHVAPPAPGLTAGGGAWATRTVTLPTPPAQAYRQRLDKFSIAVDGDAETLKENFWQALAAMLPPPPGPEFTQFGVLADAALVAYTEMENGSPSRALRADPARWEPRRLTLRFLVGPRCWRRGLQGSSRNRRRPRSTVTSRRWCKNWGRR